jgi:hypothetical protein
MAISNQAVLVIGVNGVKIAVVMAARRGAAGAGA